LFIGVYSSENKTTIAILDFKSTTIDTAILVPIATRLSSEIVKTGTYTVVERSEMQAILKEQGFQQTGCTDQNCAIEAGQLLNVQFIITGTVDKLGNIYSINVRMINVATGEISKSISDDCVDCTIDDFVIKTIRRAAFKLVGKNIADKSDEKVIEALKVQQFLYKGKRIGKLGNVTFNIKPIQSHIIFDDSAYGFGNVLIENAPAKRYRYKVIPENIRYIPYYGTVNIQPDEIADVSISLRKAYFCIGIGYSIAFFNTKFSYDPDTVRIKLLSWYDSLGSHPETTLTINKKLEYSGWVPVTMFNANIGAETRYSYYSMLLLFSLGNVFSPPDRSKSRRDFAGFSSGTISSQNDTLYYGLYAAYSYGLYFSYLRKIFNFNDALVICAGLNAGFGQSKIYIDYYKLNSHGNSFYNYNFYDMSNFPFFPNNSFIAGGMNEFGILGSELDTNARTCWGIENYNLGGPQLMLTFHDPKDRISFFINYMLGLGFNNSSVYGAKTSSFTVSNQIKAGLNCRF